MDWDKEVFWLTLYESDHASRPLVAVVLIVVAVLGFTIARYLFSDDVLEVLYGFVDELKFTDGHTVAVVVLAALTDEALPVLPS